MKEKLSFLMKKIIFIIKSTIKLILIYSFIHAVSNIIFSLYPIETSQKKNYWNLNKKIWRQSMYEIYGKRWLS